MLTNLKLSEELNEVPPEWSVDLLPENRKRIQASDRKVIVLDDDPTGTQTVHDVHVLTEWMVDTIAEALLEDKAGFYILTNSRSFSLEEARVMNQEIGENIILASKKTGTDFVVVSRSDSTLRGHFPDEVQALSRALKTEFDGILIIPFFKEGGRFTYQDVHYVAEGDRLIPAAQTPFAEDLVFGYRSSNLKEWVEEKTSGEVKSQNVVSVSINEIRRGGPQEIARKLRDLSDEQVCIVNALTYRDMDTFVAGLLNTEEKGKRFLYRTAASFVRCRLGLGSAPLLSRDDLNIGESGGGLIIVGSYVPLSTQQLETLLIEEDVLSVEVNVPLLIDPKSRDQEIHRVILRMNDAISGQRDTVVYTSRELISTDEKGGNLLIGKTVSESLVLIVKELTHQPRYILAKGGITASDIAVKSLGVRKGLVVGQIRPGVPVWELQSESRYPGLPYIVFPGNVGDKHAIADIVSMLKDNERYAG